MLLMQVAGTTGRRLQQTGPDTVSQYVAVMKAAGEATSTDALVSTIQNDPCQVSNTGMGLCDTLGAVTLQTAPVIRTVVSNVAFSAGLVSYPPGKLQIRTAYFADGNLTTVMVPRVANGSAESTNYLRCTAQIELEGTYLLTCDTTLRADENMVVTVSVDSLAAAMVLTDTVQVAGSGEGTDSCCPQPLLEGPT